MTFSREKFIKEVVEKNNYDETKRLLEIFGWKECLKSQSNSQTILNSAGNSGFFHFIHAVVDLMAKEKNFNDTNDEYQLGSLLCNIAHNDTFECSITRDALAAKIIKIGIKNHWHIKNKYPLHLCIDKKRDQTLIALLAGQEGALEKEYEKKVPVVYAAENDAWDIAACLAKKDINLFAKQAKAVGNIAIQKNKLDEFINASKEANILSDVFHKIMDTNEYNLVTQFMKRCSWKEFCKEKKSDKMTAVRLGDNAYFHSIHAMINVMADDQDFNDKKGFYELGFFLCDIANSDKFECSITRAQLAEKIIKIGVKNSNYKIDKKYPLHLCIAKKRDKELVNTLAKEENALENEYEGKVPVVYAAENDAWDIVVCLAKKDITLFAKQAKEIGNIAIQEKKLDELIKASSEDALVFSSVFCSISESLSSIEATLCLFHAVALNCTDAYEKLFPIVEKSLRMSTSNPYTLIIPQYNNITLLELGCKNRSWDCVEKIVVACQIKSNKNQTGFMANRDMSSWHLAQALYWAISNDNPYYTQMFFEYGASFSGDGSAEIMLAVKNNNSQIASLLLSKKANYRDALFSAIQQDKYDLVETILSFSKEFIEDYDINGNKALWLACNNNNSKMVELLLSHGADPNRLNGESKTMAQYAESKGKNDCAATINTWNENRHKQKLALLYDLQNVKKMQFKKETQSSFFGESKWVGFEPQSYGVIATTLKTVKTNNAEDVSKALQTIRMSLNEECQANKRTYNQEALTYLKNLSVLIEETEKNSSSSSSASFKNVDEIIQTIRPVSPSNSSTSSKSTNSNSPGSTSFMNTVMNAFRSDSPSAPEQSVVQYNSIQQQQIPAVQQDLYCVDQSGQYYRYSGQDLSGNSIWTPIYFAVPLPVQQPISDQPPSYDSIATQPGVGYKRSS